MTRPSGTPPEEASSPEASPPPGTGWLRGAWGGVTRYLGGASVHRLRWIAKGVRVLPLALRSGVQSPLLEREIRLPAPAETPVVSIIIPVYGHMEITLQCLESLARMKTELSYEVVVVDDQSPDATPGALALLPELVLLTNQENLGFVGSCNAGAQAAQGDYLLFLNSDTEVPDQCLDRLVEIFEHRKDAGLVGAKLVYPTGMLQECGAIIWQDATGWNYGNGQSSQDPEYQYVREVDYVSGACLMIPTPLFRDLEGFDERYAPGYYEDTDLAFRVREAGVKVYVHPGCEVVHHEGVSSGGGSPEVGMKRFQEINRRKFQERWSTTLASQPVYPGVLPELAMRHRCVASVVVVDATTGAGMSTRMPDLVEGFLKEGAHVTFLCHAEGIGDVEIRRLQDAGARVLSLSAERSLTSCLESLEGEVDLLLLAGIDPLDTIRTAIRDCCPGAQIIFDEGDAAGESLRLNTLLEKVGS